MLFYSGQERPAASILTEQARNMADEEKFRRVGQMVELAEGLRTALEKDNLDSFGDILDQGWHLKRGLASGITNAVVESNYRLAREAGAAGGKLLGAGAGGFLLLSCRPEMQQQVRVALAHRDAWVVVGMMRMCCRAYEAGRTQVVFGNGGSAALASHFACDIGKGTVAGRAKRLQAIALTDNVALITAWANDKAYEEIFSEQLESLAEKGDIALAISGSGNSPNVIRGLEAGRRLGVKTLVLTGFAGGRAKTLADLCLIVRSDNMQYIAHEHLCARLA